jgi:hypothetical protein
MKEEMLKLPIVNKKNVYKQVSIATFIFFILGYISIFTIDSNNLHTILFGLGAIAGIVRLVMGHREIKGFITFKKEELIIENKGIEPLRFPLSQLSRLRIMMKKGLNNFIRFEFEQSGFSYDFLLKREYTDTLNQIFEAWRSNNYDFKVYNDGDEEIDKL